MSAGYSNPISEDDIKCVLCGHRPEIFGHETEVYDEGVRGKCRWKCDWCGQKGYAEFDSAFDSLTVKDEFSSMYVRYRKAPIRLSGLECHWCERPIELGDKDGSLQASSLPSVRSSGKITVPLTGVPSSPGRSVKSYL